MKHLSPTELHTGWYICLAQALTSWTFPARAGSRLWGEGVCFVSPPGGELTKRAIEANKNQPKKNSELIVEEEKCHDFIKNPFANFDLMVIENRNPCEPVFFLRKENTVLPNSTSQH